MTGEKYLSENNEFFYDESSSQKNSSLRQDFELFDDESYVPGQLVQIKRNVTTENEDWEILVDKRQVFVIKGQQLSLKARKFLRTQSGMSFIMSEFKSGVNTMSRFKALIREKIV
jgi:transcription elongation factor